MPAALCVACLVLGVTIITVWAIVCGALAVPVPRVLLNPVVGIVAILVLRKFGIIVGGDMGIGAALCGVLLILAGCLG